MNFGAKHNPSKDYDKKAMMTDLSPEKLEDSSIRNMILRQTHEAIEWYESRGNCGDNVDMQTLVRFSTAILAENAKDALENGHTLLETQMHPTAEDICKDPVKQFVYNVCGKRAYRYELDE